MSILKYYTNACLNSFFSSNIGIPVWDVLSKCDNFIITHERDDKEGDPYNSMRGYRMTQTIEFKYLEDLGV